MWDSICYLNGEYLKLQDAKISVLDRGFIFGDGVYEVVPVYQRKPFCMDEHLERLGRSLNAVSLQNPYSADRWKKIISTLIQSHTAENQFVYFQITRGVAKRDHAFPENVKPTVFAMSSPFSPPSGKILEDGVATITTVDNRWLRCEVKSISLLGNVLKRQEAVQAGVLEVIMFRDGWLTEGSSANIYAVINDQIIAPPRDNKILAGIRYGLMQRLCNAAGVVYAQRQVSKAELLNADEILMSSATKEILAVTQVDEKPVGHGPLAGRPGAIWKKLFNAYQQEKQLQCAIAPTLLA